MRYSIVTPTLQREQLIRACKSVNRQTCTDWEHLVIFDGEFEDKVLLEKLQHPQRLFVPCQTPGDMSHAMGNSCRHFAYSLFKGDYVFYLDDDDYLLSDYVLEDLLQVTAPWALFPMLHYGERFFNDPPTRGGVATENILVKREFSQWPNIIDIDADSVFVYNLMRTHPYQSLPSIRPVVGMDEHLFGKK